MLLRLYVGTLLALSVGCSGASAPTAGASEVAPAPQVSPEEAQRQEALRALRSRQDEACERLGPVLTRCAVEDAERTMSAEELAELDLANTAPRHQSQLVSECRRSELSERQVEVYESCLAGDTSCEVFVPCLDAAAPQAPSP